MTAVATMPETRGKLTESAPLAPLVWFKSGGPAQWLFEPKDIDDLRQFLRALDPDLPVMRAIGVPELAGSKRTAIRLNAGQGHPVSPSPARPAIRALPAWNFCAESPARSAVLCA